MPKKILLINGSPRKNGLTSALLKIFTEKVKEISESEGKVIEITTIHLSDYQIQHCIGCDSCLRSPNTCPLGETDDMLKLEEFLKSADAIILGSPSYFGGVSGLMKALFDRSRPLKMAKYQLKDKYFSPIAVSGFADSGINWVQDAMIHWALIHGMVVVGALGHPVIMPNLPGETLQMGELKAFRKVSEPGEISTTVINNLASRICGFLN